MCFEQKILANILQYEKSYHRQPEFTKSDFIKSKLLKLPIE